MKKKFSLELMYGDGDEYKKFEHITENENEIALLSYFFENYNKELYSFYESPSYFFENICDDEQRKNIISTINKLIELSNVLSEEQIILIKEDFDIGRIVNLFVKVLYFIDEYFGWDMYFWKEEYFGYPSEYLIEDISDKIEITKQEAIKLFKDKLNMDVTIID